MEATLSGAGKIKATVLLTPEMLGHFYVPSHLHVDSGAFISAGRLLKTGPQQH